MERISPDLLRQAPVQTEKRVGKFRRWFRTALLTVLPLLCGGDSPSPYSHQYTDSDNSHLVHFSSSPRPDGLPGIFFEERQKNLLLTEEQYLDLLARELNTPEKMDAFLKTRMSFVARSSASNPKRGGHLHAQTAQETSRRIENGKMLGNCADYASFGQEILQRQGKVAHILAPPGHAVCVWLEQRPNGKYDGFGLDEHGVNKNGELHYTPQRPLGKGEPRTPDGYRTMIEAVNAVLQHYPDESSDPPNYSVSPYYIPVLRTRLGLHYEDVVTIHALDPDGSIISKIGAYEASAIFALLVGGYAMYALRRRRKGGETWKKYSTRFRLY